ncbi:MAG: glycosyltransferase family 87 protein [Candidatus Sumerlaeia bacterium]
MNEISQNASFRQVTESLLVQISLVSLIVLGLLWYATFRLGIPLTGEPFQSGLHGNDFKHIYLGPWMLSEDQNPYDAEALMRAAKLRGLGAINPYVYPPFTALVMTPLSKLSPPTALKTWFILNHLFLISACALIFLGLGLRPDLQNLCAMVLLAALSWPLHRTLTAGQLNLVLLLCFAAVFFFMRLRRPWIAGAIGAFAFLFKLIPGILLAYFFWSDFTLSRTKPQAVHSRRRLCIFSGSSWSINMYLCGLWAMVSMVLFSLLLLGLSVWGVGWDIHREFWPILQDMGYGKSTWADFGMHFYRDAANQSLNSLFHHLFVAWEGFRPWISLGPQWANNLTKASWLVCVALLIWRTFPIRKGDPEMHLNQPILYGLFVLLALLTPSIYWDHYMILCLIPLMACFGALPGRSRGLALALMVLIMFGVNGVIDRSYLWSRYGLGMLEQLSLIEILLRVLFILVCLLVLLKALMLLAGVLMSHGEKHSLLALWWALSAAMVTMRFPYASPAFHHGPFMIFMSLGLIGTLSLFGLSLYLVSRPVPERA